MVRGAPRHGVRAADPGCRRAEEIRGPEVTRHVSRVAQMPAVRAWVTIAGSGAGGGVRCGG